MDLTNKLIDKVEPALAQKLAQLSESEAAQWVSQNASKFSDEAKVGLIQAMGKIKNAVAPVAEQAVEAEAPTLAKAVSGTPVMAQEKAPELGTPIKAGLGLALAGGAAAAQSAPKPSLAPKSPDDLQDVDVTDPALMRQDLSSKIKPVNLPSSPKPNFAEPAPSLIPKQEQEKPSAVARGTTIQGENQNVIKAASSPTATAPQIKAGVAQVQNMVSPAQATAANSAGPSPELESYSAPDFSKAYEALDTLSKNLPKREKVDFDKKLADLDKKYKDEAASLENKELAETLAHAFTQLAAGIYGLNTGLDMSGLKFSKTDWEKRLDRAYKNYDSIRDQINKEKAQDLGLQEKDTEFQRDVAVKAASLKGEEAKDISQAKNKGISDRNKSVLDRLEDERKAAENEKARAAKAGETDKELEAKRKIAELDAKTNIQVAKIKADASRDNTNTRVNAPPKPRAASLKEPKDTVDPVVKNQIALVDSGLKRVQTAKTNTQREQAAKSTLQAMGYDDAKLQDLTKDVSWFSGPSRSDIYTSELAKVREGLNAKLVKPGKPSGNTTNTVDKPADSGYIRIKHKPTGKVKSLPKDAAERALQDPNFERL